MLLRDNRRLVCRYMVMENGEITPSVLLVTSEKYFVSLLPAIFLRVLVVLQIGEEQKKHCCVRQAYKRVRAVCSAEERVDRYSRIVRCTPACCLRHPTKFFIRILMQHLICSTAAAFDAFLGSVRVNIIALIYLSKNDYIFSVCRRA